MKASNASESLSFPSLAVCTNEQENTRISLIWIPGDTNSTSTKIANKELQKLKA